MGSLIMNNVCQILNSRGDPWLLSLEVFITPTWQVLAEKSVVDEL